MKRRLQNIYEIYVFAAFRENNFFQLGRCMQHTHIFQQPCFRNSGGKVCLAGWTKSSGPTSNCIWTKTSVLISVKGAFDWIFDPSLVLQCIASRYSPTEATRCAFVTSRCLLLFQLWTNPPLTMVSKGYRRLSPGTLVTPSACQRSAQSLLFY